MPAQPAASKPALNRRALPAVEHILQRIGPHPRLPRPLIAQAVRAELAATRSAPLAVGTDTIVTRVGRRLETLERRRLQPVINATGVLLHTNLGRAPMGPVVGQSLLDAATRYTNLEYDLETGDRGPRGAYLEELLAGCCHAESATMVNNCAAALVLILRHLTSGARKEVLISRGELVQIGGGFRIPEILEVSGAVLREVGTTNRTTLTDYRRAIGAQTGLLLKVHRSNFYMGGFVESPPRGALATLARTRRIPLIEDLGSGALVETRVAGDLPHEPTPAEVLDGGADLACFSGDKLLGGPQCGIIAGRRRLVRALKANPLFRALRCDKLALAALQAVAEAYLATPGRGRWPATGDTVLPLLALLRIPATDLEARARAIAASLEVPANVRATVVRTSSQVGGGTLPQAALPSAGLEIESEILKADTLARLLRSSQPAVIGYVTRKRFRLDLRTVFADQDATLAASLRKVLTQAAAKESS